MKLTQSLFFSKHKITQKNKIIQDDCEKISPISKGKIIRKLANGYGYLLIKDWNNVNLLISQTINFITTRVNIVRAINLWISSSRQDLNPVLSLATRAGKIVLYYTTKLVQRANNYNQPIRLLCCLSNIL